MAGVPPPETRRATIVAVLTASAGLALFVWLVAQVGASDVWEGFRQIGWGLALLVLLGGLRFASRALAWISALEPPYQLRFRDAFAAVVCGDTIGNVVTLGPVVSEAAKLAFVRGRVPLGPAMTALAVENLFYTLSVAAMIAAATLALLFTFELPAALRESSEIALGVIAAGFVAAALLIWRRPALLASLPLRWRPGRGSRLHSPFEKLRVLEREVYSFASRRPASLVPVLLSEAGFHAFGVLETHVTLWMITGAAPPLLVSFILEGAIRLIAVLFKFVPFQIGVGEAGTGAFTRVLGLGYPPGVTLALARKARMAVWSIVGAALLVRHGISARRILEYPPIEEPRG